MFDTSVFFYDLQTIANIYHDNNSHVHYIFHTIKMKKQAGNDHVRYMIQQY